MPITIPAPPSSSQAQVDAIAFLQQSDAFLLGDIQEVKQAWLQFWDVNQGKSYLQSKVDYLAGIPATDQSGANNAFTVLCAVALRRIAYCLSEVPTCFDDAKVEHAGAIQPNGQAYKQYFSCGWYWTIDGTKPSGMAFSTPVGWAS